jgi:AcrR family transcriptional regulator
MPWDFHRRGYHHGNLREALMQAAIDLIADKGPSGFTFAEAARAAGVSPAAPYRHFRDRDALMAEVATRGFVKFAFELERAWDEGRPDPQAAFIRLGRTYLAFARSEPAYYAAMFENALPRASHPGLDDAGRRAFDVLRAASESICALLPKERRPPELMRRSGAPSDPDVRRRFARGGGASLSSRHRSYLNSAREIFCLEPLAAALTRQGRLFIYVNTINIHVRRACRLQQSWMISASRPGSR